MNIYCETSNLTFLRSPLTVKLQGAPHSTATLCVFLSDPTLFTEKTAVLYILVVSPLFFKIVLCFLHSLLFYFLGF